MASNYEEKYTEQEWICVLQDHLAAYEDTGLEPEEVNDAVVGSKLLAKSRLVSAFGVAAERLREIDYEVDGVNLDFNHYGVVNFKTPFLRRNNCASPARPESATLWRAA